VIPIARVSPPNAAGTVQFADGNTTLGGPAPVFGGLAIGGFLILSPGSHSLTGVFTPADSVSFASSTSAAVPVKFGPLSLRGFR